MGVGRAPSGGAAEPVQLVGLLGTAVGTVVLPIGVFRAHVDPCWAWPALWAFLALELVGSAVAAMLGLAAATLAVIAFVALAATVWSSPRSTWASGAGNPAETPAPAMA